MNKKKRKEVIKKNNEKEIINSYWRLFKDLKAKITFWDKLKHFLALDEKVDDKKYWLIKGDFDNWLFYTDYNAWILKQYEKR